MTREALQTDAAPAAIGTYSQAIRHGDTLYVSGQIPLDPATGEIVSEDVHAQIRMVFQHLTAIAEAAGTSLSAALKINVFLTDLQHFALVNEVMAEFLEAPYPARAAMQVSALPRGVAVEADAVIAL